QRRAFGALAERTGLTGSEHIHRALDAYIAEQRSQRQGRQLPTKEVVFDAEGFAHATLTEVDEEEFHNEDHDIARLAWTFTPAMRGKGPGPRHRLWTGRVFAYEPDVPDGTLLSNETPVRPNLFARLLIALGAAPAVEDARYGQHLGPPATLNLESLVGRRVKY